MILEIDIGNTRAKWRAIDANGALVRRGSWKHGPAAISAAEFDAMFDCMPCERIRVASVADDELSKRLSRRAAAHQCSIEFASASAVCAGVTNSYSQPARMGVDRWLAMLAAYNEYKDNVCVIDCGTTVTVDVVTAAGQHLGGLIMPGLQLQQNALRQHTDKVIFSDQPEVGELQLGTHTSACVHNGSKFMLIGAVHEALNHVQRQLNADVQCVIAGGDAALILSLLRVNALSAPDLVLDGLKYALP